MLSSYRRLSVVPVVEVSALQSLNLNLIPISSPIKDFKIRFLQLPYLRGSVEKRRQVCLLCPWVRHLTRYPIFAWRTRGGAVQSSCRGSPV